jgi:hypothetical protein
MANELHVGIFERDANGKKVEIDVSNWKKLEDCTWDKMPQIFGKIPQQVALLRPKAEMLKPEGLIISVGEKASRSWANVTFDQSFVAECLRRDFVDKLGLEPKTALEKIGEWLNWISQKDTREIKAKVDMEVVRLQQEYVKVYGSPLPVDEAIKTLKVSQPMLMRDFQSAVLV